MKNILKDSQGRDIKYLRLSVTDRCNLECRYCVTKERKKFLSHHNILRYEEMLRVVTLLSKHGLEKVRLTGGEPLVRKDVDLFAKELNSVKGIKEVTLTTNGVILEEYVSRLKRAGIKRLNLSLDSLKDDVFEKITGKNRLKSVLRGIDAACEAGMSPIKINTVLLNGINDSEIADLAGLSIEKNIDVRFIELMPIGSTQFYNSHKLSMKDAKEMIEKRFSPLLNVKSSPISGPASMYKIKGAKGNIGFIHAMTSHFCADCNRVRITAEGLLRPCLLEDSFFDLRRDLRLGASNEDLYKIVKKALEKKSSIHEVMPDVKRQMVSIGG